MQGEYCIVGSFVGVDNNLIVQVIINSLANNTLPLFHSQVGEIAIDKTDYLLET